MSELPDALPALLALAGVLLLLWALWMDGR